MIKRYVGLDLLDIVIHAGVTIAAAVMMGQITMPQEEIGVGFAFMAGFVALGWRRVRAKRQQAELEATSVPAERLLELEDRMAELEAGQGRMVELEERLDFAERLLARETERARLPRDQGERV
jgi:membrane protein implicated in regulation of membrane protease activity